MRAKRLLRNGKGNMVLKSLKTQNIEFKSNLPERQTGWRDESGNISLTYGLDIETKRFEI